MSHFNWLINWAAVPSKQIHRMFDNASQLCRSAALPMSDLGHSGLSGFGASKGVPHRVPFKARARPCLTAPPCPVTHTMEQSHCLHTLANTHVAIVDVQPQVAVKATQGPGSNTGYGRPSRYATICKLPACKHAVTLHTQCVHGTLQWPSKE